MGHNKERARLESTGKFLVLNSNTQTLCQINKIRNLGVGPKNYKSPPGYCVARSTALDQSMTQGSLISMSRGNLLEVKILRPYSRWI